MYFSTFLRNIEHLFLYSSTFQKYFDFQVFFEYLGLFYAGIIFQIQKCVTGVAGVSCSLADVSSVASESEWAPHKPVYP